MAIYPNDSIAMQSAFVVLSLTVGQFSAEVETLRQRSGIQKMVNGPI